ncbi:hypothetical protein QC763_120900 [Podospora pseudopauciseta]|uniref:Zn(2)-C6 fungal-type domain-containing protein n=1 Tax=Podospora pseudopauciseta TaxID=2093780 RepID=A0ABR0I273_9PEZI|nr:hypothetical protein QC763_120900 [Podospora pseudopauciseta]
MADNHRRAYPPPREGPESSHYPPPPEEDEDRRRLPPVGGSGMSLPSISSYPPPPASYLPSDPRYQDRGYSADPRYHDSRSWPADPQTPGGYPPPPPDSRYPPLPSVNAPPRRYDDRPPYDDRRPYDDHRPYNDPYYGPPPHASRPPSYPPPGSDPYYRYPPGTPYPYGAPQQAPPQQQAAPRQRTSIACRYCRKRKIRCSGYQNTQNGKCTNCDKLRIDCVFQPVSSNSSAAFVPVQALPGGVPPGTPLFGAWGQPLGSTGSQGPPPQRPYPQHPPSDYPPPLNSPTAAYPPYDDREGSRRRSRPPEDDPSLRPGPPNYPPDDDPRRRSPASNHSNGTPPTGYHQYQHGVYDQDRTPTPQKPSPSGPGAAPMHPQQPPPLVAHSPPSGASTNPMSLGHLISTDERERGGPNAGIDRDMLGRLGRRS